MRSKTRVITNYMEHYKNREASITIEQARAVLDSASVVYVVQQGDITIPAFDNQVRSVCVLRFEHIITPASKR